MLFTVTVVFFSFFNEPVFSVCVCVCTCVQNQLKFVGDSTLMWKDLACVPQKKLGQKDLKTAGVRKISVLVDELLLIMF